MSLFTTVILALVGLFGIVIGHTLAVRHKVKRYKKEQERTSAANRAWRQKQEAHKKELLQQLVRFIDKKERVTNDDVQQLLGVSDATATRYLDMLEKEGKIEQKGEGRGTYYKLR